jgi:Uma2 family endonuclease
LNAGTLLVWLIYPNTREVVVHLPDGHSQVYGESDVLEFPVIMPGFKCRLEEVL